MAYQKIHPDKAILFHIGYYKTGSSFLQKNIFGDPNSGFHAVAPNDITSPMGRARYLTNQFFTDDNGHILSPWQGLSQSTFEESSYLINLNDGMPVISHERFLGYPFASGLDAVALRERIFDFCPSAKILIVIRNQYDLILSTYIQYIRRGGNLSLKNALTTKYDNRIAFFSKAYYYYHLAINGYIDRFGKKNVLVLPYELLKENQNNFLTLIYDFCEIDFKETFLKSETVNRSNSLFIENIFRPINFLTSRGSINGYSPVGLPVNGYMDKIKKTLSLAIPTAIDIRTKIQMQNEIQKVFPLGTFSKSNKIVEQLTDLDLGYYGYK